MATIEIAYAGIYSMLCWLAVTTINRMSHETRGVIRWSYVLIAIGAFGQLLWALPPANCDTTTLHELGELTLSVGAASLVFFDQRYRKPWGTRHDQ